MALAVASMLRSPSLLSTSISQYLVSAAAGQEDRARFHSVNLRRFSAQPRLFVERALDALSEVALLQIVE
jgi:hypothetical protein